MDAGAAGKLRHVHRGLLTFMTLCFCRHPLSLHHCVVCTPKHIRCGEVLDTLQHPLAMLQCCQRCIISTDKHTHPHARALCLLCNSLALSCWLYFRITMPAITLNTPACLVCMCAARSCQTGYACCTVVVLFSRHPHALVFMPAAVFTPCRCTPQMWLPSSWSQCWVREAS